MNNRIKTNQIKLVILILLSTFLGFWSITVKAQALHQKEGFYKGFESSFGSRSYNINSSIGNLDQLTVGQEGGRVGIILGNRVVQANVQLLGYFFSTSSMAGSIDLYENGVSVNFYPMALLFNKEVRVEPYFTGGLTYERIKFRGYYLSNDNGPINYSTCEEPFLGAINQVNAYLGVGVDFKIIDQYDFVHLF